MHQGLLVLDLSFGYELGAFRLLAIILVVRAAAAVVLQLLAKDLVVQSCHSRIGYD